MARSWNELGVETVARFGHRGHSQRVLHGEISLISAALGGGMVRISRSALSCVSPPRPCPSQLLLTLLVFWLHWSSERVCFCLGRAASVLRAQSWLSPSLHEWIWCQGQGKAAAAAPEHHLPTCLPVKVLLAPGEAPAFHSGSPQSTETWNMLPQAQSLVPTRELYLPKASVKFPSFLLKVILFNSYVGLKT